MTMRSSVFSVPASTPFDASGYLLDAEGQVVPGYVRATDPDLPVPADDEHPERHVVGAAHGYPVLPIALSVAWDSAAQGPWELEAMAVAFPAIAPYVLEREVEVATEDGPVRVRQKMARAVPPGGVVVAEGLPPFLWTDEAHEHQAAGAER